MSFASFDFFLCLALALAAFQFVPPRAASAFLLACSLAWYAAATWASGPLALALLVGTIVLGWWVALRIETCRERRDPRASRAWLAVAIAAHVALLVVFKYAAIAIEPLNAVLGVACARSSDAAAAPRIELPELLLPLGLSFYTFQSISYLVDVRRGTARATPRLAEHALYVAFFPQIAAGPISRATELVPQLRAPRAVERAHVSLALRRLLWGSCKKLVLAEPLRAWTLPALLDPSAHPCLELWGIGAALLAVLYLDLSAYTDIARGGALLFGIELPANFRAPFAATNFVDMWRRWHMSLTAWIADYVVSPLTRPGAGLATLWRNSLLTMVVFGLWHGASWKYVAWGLANGAVVGVVHTWRYWRRKRGAKPRRDAWTALSGWCAAQAVSIPIVMSFFAPDLERALAAVRGLWPLGAHGAAFDARTARMLAWLAFALALHVLGARVDLAAWWARVGRLGRAAWFAALLAALVWLGEREPSEFIYFRF